MKVIALYDFQAQPNTGEISIQKDEIITVIRQDVGEGWWEGINSRSQKGLFPAEYVSLVADSVDNLNDNIPNNNTSTFVAFSNTSVPAAPNNDLVEANYQQYDPDADWADDDWDDDDSQGSEFTNNDYSPTNLPQNQLAPIHVSGGNKNSQSTIKIKSINRLSSFVKSGGEDYILGLKTYNVNQNDYIHIILENSLLKWSPSYFTVTVSVQNPQKQSKMKGLKSYIAYELTPSDTKIPVSRRYKHFDWLHDRLQDKFTTIPIPSLPDKQISGRYQDEFIQNRQIQLQSWVNRICRHPVLSQSTVWKHFITCKDEKQWKNGKRRAEKDELVGGLFFLTIQVPENDSSEARSEKKLEQFFRFINKFDESTKNTYNVAQEMIKRYQSFYKREFSKISGIFSNLSESFTTCPSNTNENKDLVQALNYTSETYESIGKLFEEQYWHDFSPLSNLMHEYKGILTAWPEIYQIYKGSVNKKREHKKALDENRIDENSFTGICKRTNVVTYATIAEMNHFEEERINDFNNIMRTFLNGQLKLYQEIVVKIENALNHFPVPQQY